MSIKDVISLAGAIVGAVQLAQQFGPAIMNAINNVNNQNNVLANDPDWNNQNLYNGFNYAGYNPQTGQIDMGPLGNNGMLGHV